MKVRPQKGSAAVKAHMPHSELYTISACMITCNESPNIARSIESCRDFVDEIVVVDTGSTDDTAAVARAAGARVAHFDWCGDFSAARNFALDRVKGDWIIFLDADEYFSKNAGERVKRCIELAIRSGENLIGCKCHNIDRDDPDRKLPESFAIRILKAGVRFRHRIHEEAVPEDGKRILYAEKSRFFIWHTGYSSRVVHSKAERNLPLLLKEQKEETDDRRRQMDNSYLSDCYFTLGDYEKCRDASEQYIRYSLEHNVVLLGNAAKPYLNLLTSLAKLNAPCGEQEKWAKVFAEAFPDLPDARFVAAMLQLRRHRLLTAEKEMREAIRSAAVYGGAETSQMATMPEEGHFALGLILARQGRVSDAMVSLFQAWRLQHAYDAAVGALLGLSRYAAPAAREAFVRELFDNPDPVRRQTVLRGLMRQYMAGPLTECYSWFCMGNGKKGDSGLDGRVIAHLAAAKGNYAGAAELFTAVAVACREDRRSAMQALVCAYLAQTVTPAQMDAADPVLAVALGLREGTVRMQELPAAAEMAAEAGRMAGSERAAGLAGEMAARLAPELRREFVLCLEGEEEFAGALRVAEQMEPCGETAFLIGYFAMQLRRPGEARLAFAAARAMEYDDPARRECEAILGKTRASADPALLSRAVAQIRQGALAPALAALLPVVGRAGADREMCSLSSVCFLQTGRPHMALLAALAGLETDSEYPDLLVNAGDARRALQEPEQAAQDYAAATRFCKDPLLKEDLAAQVRRLEAGASANRCRAKAAGNPPAGKIRP